MHDHSSTKSDNTLTHFTGTIDWPYEMVHAEAQFLPLRQSNPLEQVVLQILGVFRDSPPSLAEAANELGIMDPVFLEATFGQMVEKGILEKIQAAGPLDFANCKIHTDSSDENNKSPIIENQTVQFCFDAVTSNHIPMPPEDLKDRPINPVIEPNKLPAKRMHLGLEKSRQWANNQQEPFISESGRMIEITVLPDCGKYVWQSLPVTCFIEHDGSRRFRIEQATEHQRQWLDQLDSKHPLFQKMQIQDFSKTPVKNELKPLLTTI
jgi:hypothetical protein